MKLPKLNQSGIAHILAPLLFIVVFAGIGVYLLTHSKAAKVKTGSCSGLATFNTPHEDHAFANSEKFASIAVAVPKCRHATVVVFFRDGKFIGPATSHTRATKANGYIEHYYYTWKITNWPAGSQHWTAVVQIPHSFLVAKNNRGNQYLDTLVIGNGNLSDSKFTVPANNAVWKRCDQSKYLRVEVEGDRSQFFPATIKGVQFVNTSPDNPDHFELTQPSDIRYGSTFSHHPKMYVRYDYHPVGADCLKKGHYDWIARVIGNVYSLDGTAKPTEVLAKEQAVPGVYVYHLELTVK